MRLRSALSPHSCTGYEISFKATKTGAYLIIVRWNGQLGDFTYLSTSGAQYGVTTATSSRRRSSGNVITAYLNGVEMGRRPKHVHHGQPGHGVQPRDRRRHVHRDQRDYGYTSYSATAGP